MMKYSLMPFTILSKCTNMKHLTAAFNVSIVTSDDFVRARETRHWQVIEICNLLRIVPITLV